MEQQVSVIAVEGRDAIVSGRRASACGDCAGKASCSTMGSWVERTIELRLSNTIAAQVGDQVLLEVPDSAVLRIAFRLYAMPMLAFVLAGLAARSLALYLGWPAVELVAALSGFVAVLSYYLWYRRSLAGSGRGLDVRMLRILSSGCDSGSVRQLTSSH